MAEYDFVTVYVCVGVELTGTFCLKDACVEVMKYEICFWCLCVFVVMCIFCSFVQKVV